MEIYSAVWTKRLPDRQPELTTEAYFTFVALDKNAKPTSVIPVKPVTTIEKKITKKL